MAKIERDWEIVSDYPKATSGVYVTVNNGDFFINDLGSSKIGVMHWDALANIKGLKYRNQVIDTLKNTFLPDAEKMYIHEDALAAINHIIATKGGWEVVSDYPEEASGIYVTVSNGNFFLKDLESSTMGFVHCSALIANLKYRSEAISALKNAFLPSAEKLYIHEDAMAAIDRLIEANRLLF